MQPKKHFIWDIAAIIAFISLIVNATWYISTLQKTAALHEEKIDNINSDVLEMKKELEHENDMQDASLLRFEEQVNARLLRVDSKVDMICRR